MDLYIIQLLNLCTKCCSYKLMYFTELKITSHYNCFITYNDLGLVKLQHGYLHPT